MDVLTHDDLTTLAEKRPGPRVSIYLPTERFGTQAPADRTRLKLLLQQAEALLAEATGRTSAAAMLAPARALLEERAFWLGSDLGLALFLEPGSMRAFRLSEPFSEQVYVGERFYLKPLLALAGNDVRYWVLALSQKHVRLLRGTGASLAEVDLRDAPQSLADALRWDDLEKASLQYHSLMRAGTGGRRPAVYHGNADPDPKDDLLRYFRAVDRAVREYLHDDASPLILAGVDFLLPIYREVNSHPSLLDEAVVGSPENTREAVIAGEALRIASAQLARQREAAAERIDDLWGSERTTADLEKLVPAAYHGRVETLFVALDEAVWGVYDAGSDTLQRHVKRHPDDEDLLDAAAFEALFSGAEVYAVPAEQIPHGTEAVALLRY